MALDHPRPVALASSSSSSSPPPPPPPPPARAGRPRSAAPTRPLPAPPLPRPLLPLLLGASALSGGAASSSAPPACTDGPKAWEDAEGRECRQYKLQELCTESGDYGPGWNASWGTFDDVARHGHTAATACCACGGGVETTCVDWPPTWVDVVGRDCATYERRELCTQDGGYGPHWSNYSGSFLSNAVNGYAASTACCACGGGREPATVCDMKEEERHAAEFCLPRRDGDCQGNLWRLIERKGCRNPLDGVKTTGYGNRPVFVDVNLDGRVDLVVGLFDGSFMYFEQSASGEFEERAGPDQNPFHSVRAGPDPQPAFADVDNDNLTDLVIGSNDTDIRFWKRLVDGTFEEQVGERSPFSDISNQTMSDISLFLTTPLFLDWDRDGDQDLLLPHQISAWRFFEQTAEHGFVELVGIGINPFDQVRVVDVHAIPAFVDWDSDGDLDLVVGTQAWGVIYFERDSVGKYIERSVPTSNPFSGLDPLMVNPAPAFVDLDADGDMDLVLGTGLTLKYYEHVPAPSKYVERTEPGANPFHDIPPHVLCAPAVVDLDANGLYDVVVGDDFGRVHVYWQLNMSGGDLFFQDDLLPFGNISFYEGGQLHFMAPVLEDFDSDGDLDLLMSLDSGTARWLRYFEQVSPLNFEERLGAGINPFHDIQNLGEIPRPTLVDWDGDADWDLVVATSDHRIRYWEQVGPGAFVEAASTPFDHVQVMFPIPRFADMDGDGDLDMVLGTQVGVKYYENVEGVGLVPAVGDADPFNDVSELFWPSPALVDWDGDGDLDVVVAVFSGKIILLTHGFCQHPVACSLRGICNPFSAACACSAGYGGSDCATCTPGFYSSQPGSVLPQCTACAGEGTCSLRGRCWDDAAARQASGLPTKHADMVVGNGSCSCSEPWFNGTDRWGRTTCEEGSCPEGTKEIPSTVPGSSYCEPCSAGRHSHSTRTFCKLCLAGSASKEGQGLDAGCTPCPSGRYAESGSSECGFCIGGWIPSADASGCDICGSGTYSEPGFAECRSCRMFRHSKPGASVCVVDTTLLVLLGICVFVQFMAVAVAGVRFRRVMRIRDLSQSGAGVHITTLWPHNIYPLRKSLAVPVTLAELGNHHIDTRRIHKHSAVVAEQDGAFIPQWLSKLGDVLERVAPGSPAEGSRFLVRPLDSVRLELLTPSGETIEEDWHTSLGHMTLGFPYDFIHTWVNIIPTFVLVLPLLLVPWLVWIALEVSGWANTRATGVHSFPLFFALATVLGGAFALMRRRQRRLALNPLQSRHHEFSKQLQKKNPKPGRVPPGPGRALPVGDLVTLFHFYRDFILHRNAYYLNSNITKELTKKWKLSFAELAGPQRVDFFVSHFWGMRTEDFVNTVWMHAEGVDAQEWRSLAYWVCFLSNNQWKLKEEVNDDLAECAFYKALRSGFCRATCMALDEQALPLTRVWCLFEVLQTYILVDEVHGRMNAVKVTASQPAEQEQEAKEAAEEGDKIKFTGLVYCTSKGVLGSGKSYDAAVSVARRLSTLDVSNATASRDSDKRMIARLIDEHGGMDEMNLFIRQNMSNTLDAEKKNFAHSMEDLTERLGVASEGVPL